MKRILPKILGMAIVAAVASFVLAMIAKVLIVVSFIGLAAFYIRSMYKGRKSRLQNAFGDPRLSQGYLQAQSPFNSGRAAQFGHPQHSVGIIPIN